MEFMGLSDSASAARPGAFSSHAEAAIGDVQRLQLATPVLVSSAPVSDGAQVGEVIGDYRLDRVLGAGATSRVFLGTHVRLRRRAAIKVLADELSANRRTIERLLNEARVVNDIRHPNIIDISDFIESEEPRRVALVMEFVEGPSLKAVVARPVPHDQALGMALQLVSAISAAHGAGVVHRDLKPDNILLSFDPAEVPDAVPHLKVADFGIAKIAGAELGQKPATAVMIGTPAYMAPEQIAGQPPPSAATDVYAIGEVLYELLTGDRAHPKGSMHELIRVKLRGIVPPISLPEAVPNRDELSGLIRQCLELDQRARPSLRQVRDTLLSACPDHIRRLGAGSWARVERSPDPEPETSPALIFPEVTDSTRTGSMDAPESVEPTRATELVDLVPTRAISAPELEPTQTAPGNHDLEPTRTAPGFAVRKGRTPIGLFAAFVLVPSLLGVLFVALKRPDTKAAEIIIPEVERSLTATPRMAPVPVEIRIDSDPAGAEISDASGQVLGRAPVKVTLEPGATRRVRASAPGHIPVEAEVSSSQLFVSLKLARVAAPVKTPIREKAAPVIEKNDIGEW